MSETIATRERPILFSAPMVRAILDGNKTQTRRMLRNQGAALTIGMEMESDAVRNHVVTQCPYGQPGDRLWVREAWRFEDWTEDGYPFIGYASDGSRSLRERYDEAWADRLADIWADLSAPANYNIDSRAADRRWRSPIHMPRWASRITLEIVDVRVERLHAITEKAARDEGVDYFAAAHLSKDHGLSRVEVFEYAWNAFNESRGYPFSANPWVWVLSFIRIPAP